MKLTAEEIIVGIIGFFVIAKLLVGKSPQQVVVSNALGGTTPVSVTGTVPTTGLVPTETSDFDFSAWNG